MVLGCPILKKPFVTKQESQPLPSVLHPTVIGNLRKLARLCNTGFPAFGTAQPCIRDNLLAPACA